ncbi:MAG: GNAT family N-acetyltransferase [Spirulinaceae cyanobacterium]
MSIEYLNHLPEDLTDPAIDLLYSAFAEKIIPIWGDAQQTQTLFQASVDRQQCLAAVENQKLLGLLTLQSKTAHFINPTWQRAIATYGPISGIWRKGLSLLLNHKTQPHEWYVYFVAVAPEAQGQGVGTQLFVQLEARARQAGIKLLSLNVINTNSRAESLYERLGFVRQTELEIWPVNRLLRWSFSSVILMAKPLDDRL